MTSKTSNIHILDVYEKLIDEISLIILSDDEYCIIEDPYDEKTKSNRVGCQ